MDRTSLLGFLWLLVLPATALADTPFTPSAYEARIREAVERGEPDMVLTVRKITGAVEDLNRGKVSVSSVTQVLDVKTGKLLSQSRCNPCEYNLAEWPKRPLNLWFAEESWPVGSTVRRSKAQIRMKVFSDYFKLEPIDGTEHQGIVYAFWHFDGRRATPRRPKATAERPTPPPAEEPKKPKFGPVEKIEIFHGKTKPDEVTTEPGEDSVALEAVAYARPEGGDLLVPIEDAKVFWSTSCGTVSPPKSPRITFRLRPGVDRCRVYVFEARTGKKDMVEVRRGEKPKPPVRLAITFEGGREADGVALTGSAREIELEVYAFNPAGERIFVFEPEWDVENAKVEFLDSTRQRLKVHVDEGVKEARVRVRDKLSGATDEFLIQVR
ncbi:MAG: hypothetical protein D6729_01400 [Deltaproteobacteria bacterium]|nr:MAG: hypothetical protein D6729_01400 [Deltaproteobacteria bacterium]